MHTLNPAHANTARRFLFFPGTLLALGGCVVPNAQPADPCAAKPCYPGVACTADATAANGFICGACPVGYEGDGTTCTRAKACSSNPCKNGGTCTEMTLDFFCTCTMGWTGPTCEACAVTQEGVEVCDGLDNNCDGRIDEGFDLGSDAANCGGCGNDCATDAGLWADFGEQLPQHAEVGCMAGACVVTGCQAGWRDDPATAYRDCTPPPGCDGPLVFADSHLEAKVREAIAKPTGDVLFADVAGLQRLDALGKNVGSLSGIECLASLTELFLFNNEISDITPLSTLTSLTALELWGNQISDLSVLSGLTSLTLLGLGANQISDLSALSGLTSLTTLALDNNQISDLSALSGLTSVTALALNGNQISTISPLVSNPGLGSGDWVRLRSNPLLCANPQTQSDITALRARGVELDSDCF